jgi:hypothetical protein
MFISRKKCNWILCTSLSWSLPYFHYAAGYPYNLDFDYGALSQLQHFSINNLGDPFIESNYGVHSRQFEVGVLDWFARLWELEKDEYWGYITNCGTEGNLHGILVGLVFTFAPIMCSVVFECPLVDAGLTSLGTLGHGVLMPVLLRVCVYFNMHHEFS